MGAARKWRYPIGSKIAPIPLRGREKKSLSIPAPNRPLITIQDMQRIINVTEGQIRAWIFNDSDGFNTLCVVRRGNRLFIDRRALEKWIDEGRAT